MDLPFKYLGMIIGGNPRRCEFWNPIVNKIRSRLSRWKVNGQDRLVWAGEEHQKYIVKSGYNILNREDLMQTSEIFQLLWCLKIASSAIVFAWRLLLDRLPTRYNLARGVQLGNMQCPLCQNGVETT